MGDANQQQLQQNLLVNQVAQQAAQQQAEQVVAAQQQAEQVAAQQAEYIRQVAAAVRALNEHEGNPAQNAEIVEQRNRRRLLDKLFLKRGERRVKNHRHPDAMGTDNDDVISSEDSDNDNSDEEFLTAGKTRGAGKYRATDLFTTVAPVERILAHLAPQSFKKLLRRNPEPKDGVLKTPVIDEVFHDDFSKSAKEADKVLADAQRGIYNTLRPIAILLHALEPSNDSDDLFSSQLIHPDVAAAMVEKLQDAVRIGFHEAERLRIRRRTDLAKAAEWPPALVTACKTLESSSEYDGDLFGETFHERFHSEAKHAKHRNALKQSNKPSAGTKNSNSGFRGERKPGSGNFSGGGGSGSGSSRPDFRKNPTSRARTSSRPNSYRTNNNGTSDRTSKST